MRCAQEDEAMPRVVAENRVHLVRVGLRVRVRGRARYSHSSKVDAVLPLTLALP